MAKNNYRRCLLLLILVVMCACPVIAGEQASFEIPFTYEKGHLLIKITIKNQPAEVVLATGSEHSMIDMDILFKQKRTASYSGTGIITGGPFDQVVTYTSVEDINIGEIKGETVKMMLGSMAQVRSRIGREVFGILGADFFKGRIVQFDFKNKLVRFLKKSPVEDKTSGTAASDRRIILNFAYNRKNIAYPVAEVSFDGKKMETLFDTGTVSVVSFAAAAAKQLGLPVPDKKQTAAGKAGVMRLNDFDVKDVPLTIYGSGSSFETDEYDFRATAGVGFLQNFLSTFDYSKRVLILEVQ